MPAYNPTVVYGPWRYPAYPPYYWPPPPDYYFGDALVTGMPAVPARGHRQRPVGGCNWGRGDVDINVNRYNNVNVNSKIREPDQFNHNAANERACPTAIKGAEVRQERGRQGCGPRLSRPRCRGAKRSAEAQTRRTSSGARIRGRGARIRADPRGRGRRSLQATAHGTVRRRPAAGLAAAPSDAPQPARAGRRHARGSRRRPRRCDPQDPRPDATRHTLAGAGNAKRSARDDRSWAGPPAGRRRQRAAALASGGTRSSAAGPAGARRAVAVVLRRRRRLAERGRWAWSTAPSTCQSRPCHVPSCRRALHRADARVRSLVSAGAARGDAAARSEKFPTPKRRPRPWWTQFARSDGDAVRAVLGADWKRYSRCDVDQDESTTSCGGQVAQARAAGTGRHLAVGAEGWTLPIPMVKRAGGWAFDIRAGADEMSPAASGAMSPRRWRPCWRTSTRRRSTRSSRTQRGRRRLYAQRFSARRASGMACTADAPARSPALSGRYNAARTQPGAYHGYYFRILNGAGKNAPGGAYDYRSRAG